VRIPIGYREKVKLFEDHALLSKRFRRATGDLLDV
jgi:hypothetical protein